MAAARVRVQAGGAARVDRRGGRARSRRRRRHGAALVRRRPRLLARRRRAPDAAAGPLRCRPRRRSSSRTCCYLVGFWTTGPVGGSARDRGGRRARRRRAARVADPGRGPAGATPASSGRWPRTWWSSPRCSPPRSRSGNVLAAVGAVLFVASDSMIAWDRFVGTVAPAPPSLIMVTYHLGQAAWWSRSCGRSVGAGSRERPSS